MQAKNVGLVLLKRCLHVVQFNHCSCVVMDDAGFLVS